MKIQGVNGAGNQSSDGVEQRGLHQHIWDPGGVHGHPQPHGSPSSTGRCPQGQHCQALWTGTRGDL